MFESRSKRNKILDQFRKDEAFRKCLPENSDLKPESRMHFEHNESILSVVVGESGIGKSTEICGYAKELREKGLPVIYFSFPKNAGYKFEDALNSIFGTSDEAIISQTIEENYTKKGIVATIIIDNIHYAVNNGKLDEGLLTFLNVRFFRELKMAIIMLSSVNSVGYEIKNCIRYCLNFYCLC